jgi:hypothetical protein
MKKTTWIALGAFALVLIAFLVMQNNESAPDETPVPTVAPTLRELDDQQITEIEYTDSTGVTILLEKVEALTWTSPTNPEAQVTAGKIEQLLAYLSDLSILSTLPSDTALDQLGLNEPIYSINFIMQDESTYRIEVGAPTAMSDGYYAWVDESEILVLPTTTMETIPGLMYTIVLPPTATPEPEPAATLTPTP